MHREKIERGTARNCVGGPHGPFFYPYALNWYKKMPQTMHTYLCNTLAILVTDLLRIATLPYWAIAFKKTEQST